MDPRILQYLLSRRQQNSGGDDFPTFSQSTSPTGNAPMAYDPMEAASALGGESEGMPWKEILSTMMMSAGKQMGQNQGGGQGTPIPGTSPPPPPENPFASLSRPLYPMRY